MMSHMGKHFLRSEQRGEQEQEHEMVKTKKFLIEFNSKK